MRKNILVICGGVSAEHEISIISARNLIAAIDKAIFNPLPLVISRSGIWYIIKDLDIFQTIVSCNEAFDYGEMVNLVRTSSKSTLLTVNGEQLFVDTVFPLLHGPMGEDGTLQGLLEIANIPYVGSGVLASAIGMDKTVLKPILAMANIPLVPFLTLNDPSFYLDYERASRELHSSILFVKPASMGSSVGIKKLASPSEYQEAVKHAFRYSRKVIVEKFIAGREVECAVLGNDQPQASCLGEIIPHHEFYSYQAKYLDPHGADLIVPADLSAAVSEEVRQWAIKAFQAVNCRGLARVDFFITSDSKIYVNELNTMPGFTAISMYPKLWEASGVPYPSLITQLIELANQEHELKQKICLQPDHPEFPEF